MIQTELSGTLANDSDLQPKDPLEKDPLDKNSLENFTKELKAIGKQAEKNLSKKDFYHMRAIGWFGKLSFVAGIAACAFEYYVISSVLIA